VSEGTLLLGVVLELSKQPEKSRAVAQRAKSFFFIFATPVYSARINLSIGFAVTLVISIIVPDCF
jgi:hypothetical protein